MARINGFLCCLPLEDWPLLLGFSYMIMSFLQVYYFGQAIFFDILENKLDDAEARQDDIVATICIATEIIVFIFSLLLIFAFKKKHPGLVLPWMFYVGFLDGIYAIFMLYILGYLLQSDDLPDERAMALYRIARGVVTAFGVFALHKFRRELLDQQEQDNSYFNSQRQLL